MQIDLVVTERGADVIKIIHRVRSGVLISIELSKNIAPQARNYEI